jgi:hypothetical protein
MLVRSVLVMFLVVACGKVENAKPDSPMAPADAPADAAPDAVPDAPPDAAPSHTIPAGAALWLRFDDPPADGVSDSAGAHTVTCATANCPALVPGKFGSAYQFAAMNRIAVAGTADLLPGTAFTVGAWVRIDLEPPTVNVAMCKDLGTNDCSYGFLIEAARLPCFYNTGGGHTHGATPLGLATWAHMATTWDGATKRGYVNGIEVVNAAFAAIASDVAKPLSIGDREPNSLPFTGAIDDVVFYNRALTQAELTQLAAP